ncbi:hypothetical protein ACM55G_14780 [Flavobacterium sp. LB3P122]|uniref:hypothetical protein n=1 Tax=Flavobacterium algoriphilum TaxID=3398738 RepID=UPI003A8BB99D
MKNKKLNHILLWVIAIILGFSMNSCGARKAEKIRNSEVENSVIKESLTTEKKEEGAVKVAEKTAIDDKNKTKTKETSYKPVDPTKEASVTTPDGKKHKLDNAEILIKETEQENNIKTDNFSNSEEFHKSEVSAVLKSDTKTDMKKSAVGIKVERKAWSLWNLLWLLIPVSLVAVFLKYKGKIWWV